jgi:hypothetical protein
MDKNTYYVYMYLREKDSEFGPAYSPYYIGKGKGQRITAPHTVGIPKDKSRIRFLHENLSEDDAFMWEVFWIAEFGRIDLETGCLRNLTDGGDGVSGHRRKYKARPYQSELMKLNNPSKLPHVKEYFKSRVGNKNGMFNKKHSEITIQKIKANRPDISGNKNPMYGIERTPEFKEFISEQNSNKCWIYNPEDVKERLYVDVSDISLYLAKGWQPGMGAVMSNPTKAKVICPHCDKEGSVYTMKRWHFDNCRSTKRA